MSAAPARARSAQVDRRFRERRHAIRRAQIRRRRRITASVLALLLLGAVAFAVARSPLFSITRVDVVGTDRVADVREASGVQGGENLLAADLGAVAERVEALGWVREATATRLPPSVLEIAVETREPAAVVRLDDSAWIVDVEGVVLAGGTLDEVVPIDAPDSVLPGVGVQVSDAPVRNALAVHDQLPADLRARVVRYDAANVRGLRLLVRDGGEEVWVRFGRAERVGTKAQVIDALLDQGREQAARQGEEAAELGIAEIDVRAPDNPVLVPGS